MADCKEKLFDQFPPVSTEEWMKKVTADLKGADFNKKLVWRTNEGFNVKPMYRAEDIADIKTTNSLPGEYPYVRGTKCDNEWLVRQDIHVENVKDANAKAKDLLTKGITSLGFALEAENITPENIAILLSGIDVENVELNFTSCIKNSLKLIEALSDYFKSQNINTENIKGSINFDPFKRILKRGRDFKEYAQKGAEIIKAAAALPKFRVLAVDAIMLNNAGSYISQDSDLLWLGETNG